MNSGRQLLLGTSALVIAGLLWTTPVPAHAADCPFVPPSGPVCGPSVAWCQAYGVEGCIAECTPDATPCYEAQSQGSAIVCGWASGPQFCESIPFSPFLSKEQKDKVSKFGDAFATAGGFVLLYAKACEAAGPGTPLCFAWLGGAGTALVVVGLSAKAVVLIDPPDGNFAEVVAVVLEPVAQAVTDCHGHSHNPYRNPRSCNLTSDEADGLNQLFAVWSTEIGVFRAMVTTVNRAASAAEAGDAAALDLQTQAFRGFQVQLSELFTAELTIRPSLAAQLLDNRRSWLDLFSATLRDDDSMRALQDLVTGLLP
jgi:hypothetical protein